MARGPIGGGLGEGWSFPEDGFELFLGEEVGTASRWEASIAVAVG